jgi:hypothetical protein
MTSNYKDSGYSYTNTSGGISNVPSTDIYNVVNTRGVYFLNGISSSGASYIYPIVCSTILASGMDDSDDGYIVYPGYAIQLFNGGFDSGTSNRSYIYCNYSSRPVLYSLTENNSSSTLMYPIDYYDNNSSTTASQRVLLQNNSNYFRNTTNSIRIWFRGTEVLLTNSTSACSDSINEQLKIKIFTG